MGDIFDPNNPFADQDFGFEIVDAPPPEGGASLSAQPTIDISGIDGKLNEILARLAKIPTTVPTIPADVARRAEVARVEDKIDKVLAMEIKELTQNLSGTEDNIRAIIDEVEERKAEIAAKHAEAMKEVESLILPLLYNLLKNPDREYIKWGNRTETINKQIARITSVTRRPMEF